jgi:tetrahydromethanopterin S-methyltransferase subunit D
MDWPSALTVLALVAIATAAGGAVVRIVPLVGNPAALATLGGVTVLVVASLLWGADGRPRTPYWP